MIKNRFFSNIHSYSFKIIYRSLTVKYNENKVVTHSKNNSNPLWKLQDLVSIPLLDHEIEQFNPSKQEIESSQCYFKKNIVTMRGVAKATMLPQNSKLSEVS